MGTAGAGQRLLCDRAHRVHGTRHPGDRTIVTLPDPKRRADPEPAADLAPDPPLTPRESDVLELLRRGLTTKDMAAELNLSARTIKFHVSNLLRKYEARSRIDLLARLSS